MTTSEFDLLLGKFWASTGVPVRQAGLGHGGPQPPCMSYSVLRPAFGEAAQMEADAWFGGAAATAQRDAFLEALERLLPPQGVRLAGTGGVIVISRGEKDFVKTEASGAPVLHVRIRAGVRLYG